MPYRTNALAPGFRGDASGGAVAAAQTGTDETETYDHQRPGCGLGKDAADRGVEADGVIVRFVAADRRVFGEADLVETAVGVVEVDELVRLSRIAAEEVRVGVAEVRRVTANFGENVRRCQRADLDTGAVEGDLLPTSSADSQFRNN